MKQIKIILWFDVEDYVTLESDDAFLEILNMLDQTGVRATLKFCTKKVRKFRERGRMDILEKTGRHECCFHTTDHSVHPLPPEYLDYFGFSDGVDEFYRREAAGARELSELLGKDLCSYGQPGESWAPQAFAAVRKMGIHTYMDAHPIINIDGGLFWYCGICSMTALTNLIHSKHEENQVDIMKKQFDSMDMSGDDVVFLSIYDHPTELATTIFWDEVNFPKGKNPDILQPAPLRSKEETKRNIDAIRQFIEYTLTKDNVEYITATDALQYIHHRTEPITSTDLKAYCSSFTGGISFADIRGGMLAPSELLVLLSKQVTGRMLMPELFYGPESDEVSIIQNSEFSARELGEAVLGQKDHVMGYPQLKSLYKVGGSLLNPKDVFAMLSEAVKTGVDTVPMKHGDLAAANYVSDEYQWGGGWILYPDDFDPKNIVKHTKLQCWTLKPAKV